MTAPLRTVAGVELPAPGLWVVDPGHAEIAFVGRHLGLTRVRGRFTGVEGAVTIADAPERSSVAVSVDMASVSSGDRARDEHLRSADLFDVERHPTASFRSTEVRSDGARGRVTGDLTIKGVTRPVTLDVHYLGYAGDPWGSDRAVFRASARIDREAWGITWNMVLDRGGFLVSREVTIEIEVELVRQT